MIWKFSFRRYKINRNFNRTSEHKLNTKYDQRGQKVIRNCNKFLHNVEENFQFQRDGIGNVLRGCVRMSCHCFIVPLLLQLVTLYFGSRRCCSLQTLNYQQDDATCKRSPHSLIAIKIIHKKLFDLMLMLIKRSSHVSSESIKTVFNLFD